MKYNAHDFADYHNLRKNFLCDKTVSPTVLVQYGLNPCKSLYFQQRYLSITKKIQYIFHADFTYMQPAWIYKGSEKWSEEMGHAVLQYYFLAIQYPYLRLMHRRSSSAIHGQSVGQKYIKNLVFTRISTFFRRLW